MKKNSDGVLKCQSLTKPVTVTAAEVITRSELNQIDKRIAECIQQNKHDFNVEPLNRPTI